MNKYQMKLICNVIALICFIGMIVIMVTESLAGKVIDVSSLLAVGFIGTLGIIDTLISDCQLNKPKQSDIDRENDIIAKAIADDIIAKMKPEKEEE